MDWQITKPLTALNLIMGRGPHTYQERLFIFFEVKRKVKKEIERQRERWGEGGTDWVHYQSIEILHSSWSLTSAAAESPAGANLCWEWAEQLAQASPSL